MRNRGSVHDIFLVRQEKSDKNRGISAVLLKKHKILLPK